MFFCELLKTHFSSFNIIFHIVSWSILAQPDQRCQSKFLRLRDENFPLKGKSESEIGKINSVLVAEKQALLGNVSVGVNK